MEFIIKILVRIVMVIPAIAQGMGAILLWLIGLDESTIALVCRLIVAPCFVVLLVYLYNYEQLVQCVTDFVLEYIEDIKSDDCD